MPSSQALAAGALAGTAVLGSIYAYRQEKMIWDREAEQKANEKRQQEWAARRNSQNLKGEAMTDKGDEELLLTKDKFFESQVSAVLHHVKDIQCLRKSFRLLGDGAAIKTRRGHHTP